MPLTDTEPPLPFSSPPSGLLQHPASGEIHLWRISLTSKPPTPDTLSLEEATRLEAFRLEKDRNRFLHTHVATRAILASYLQIDPAQIVFVSGPFGKPFLTDSKTTLEFNLSHSHEWALLAVSNKQPVGVDLEHHKESVNCDELAGSILTEQELQEFTQLESTERAEHFFRAWSAKESFLKCLGTGLQIDPKEVEVSSSNHGELIQATGEDASTPHFLTSLPFHPNYSASLCTPTPMTNLRCYTSLTSDN